MAKKNKKTQGGGQQFLSPEKYLQQRARTLEIGTCYVTNDIDKMKMGHVIVTRRPTIACGAALPTPRRRA